MEILLKKRVNRRTDRRILKNIYMFARISDSKRDFNGFPDPAIVADCGFIYFFGPGFWTLHVINIFLPGFRIQGENGRVDLVNKS